VSKANFIIVEPHLLPRILPACEKSGIPQSNIFLFENPLAERRTHTSSEGYKSWVDLLSHGAGTWTPFNDEHLAKETLAVLLWTSGTTGLPKAAAFSHFAMVAQGIMTHDPRNPYEVCAIHTLALVIPADCREAMLTNTSILVSSLFFSLIPMPWSTR